jgi:hypothetical protein
MRKGWGGVKLEDRPGVGAREEARGAGRVRAAAEAGRRAAGARRRVARGERRPSPKPAAPRGKGGARAGGGGGAPRTMRSRFSAPLMRAGSTMTFIATTVPRHTPRYTCGGAGGAVWGRRLRGRGVGWGRREVQKPGLEAALRWRRTPLPSTDNTHTQARTHIGNTTHTHTHTAHYAPLNTIQYTPCRSRLRWRAGAQGARGRSQHWCAQTVQAKGEPTANNRVIGGAKHHHHGTPPPTRAPIPPPPLTLPQELQQLKRLVRAAGRRRGADVAPQVLDALFGVGGGGGARRRRRGAGRSHG